MTFITSFEKVATVGAAASTLKQFGGGLKAVGRKASELGGKAAELGGKAAKVVGSEASAGRLRAKRFNIGKAQLGEGLSKSTAMGTEEAAKAIRERSKGFAAAREARIGKEKANAPGFARRHPILAGTAALGLGRIAFGGGEKKEEPDPQVHTGR